MKKITLKMKKNYRPAAQLQISESFFRESVKKDPKAPVIMGRGVIACNTPALQRWWWDGKKHHRLAGER